MGLIILDLPPNLILDVVLELRPQWKLLARDERESPVSSPIEAMQLLYRAPPRQPAQERANAARWILLRQGYTNSSGRSCDRVNIRRAKVLTH
jgi:hypothetical protein